MSGRPCELKKLQALWDPRQPIPQPGDRLPQIIAGLKALNAAEQATDDAISKAQGHRGEKGFQTLQARVAMAGMQLVRTDSRDGPQRLFIISGVTVHELRRIEDLEDLLIYLQGR